MGPATEPAEVAAPLLPPGDSREQREAERQILELIAAQLGVPLRPHVFNLPSGRRITVDGFCQKPPVLVEAWAHIGRAKSAQRYKVLVDGLKLHWLRSTVVPGARCILALTDEEAAHHFRSAKSWAAECLRDLGLEIVLVELSAEMREGVLRAQKRQFR